MGCKVKR